MFHSAFQLFKVLARVAWHEGLLCAYWEGLCEISLLCLRCLLARLCVCVCARAIQRAGKTFLNAIAHKYFLLLFHTVDRTVPAVVRPRGCIVFFFLLDRAKKSDAEWSLKFDGTGNATHFYKMKGCESSAGGVGWGVHQSQEMHYVVQTVSGAAFRGPRLALIADIILYVMTMSFHLLHLISAQPCIRPNIPSANHMTATTFGHIRRCGGGDLARFKAEQESEWVRKKGI